MVIDKQKAKEKIMLAKEGHRKILLCLDWWEKSWDCPAGAEDMKNAQLPQRMELEGRVGSCEPHLLPVSFLSNLFLNCASHCLRISMTRKPRK